MTTQPTAGNPAPAAADPIVVLFGRVPASLKQRVRAFARRKGFNDTGGLITLLEMALDADDARRQPPAQLRPAPWSAVDHGADQ